MYNSSFESIIEILLIRFILLAAIIFLLAYSDFKKESKRSTVRSFANLILIISAVIVFLGKIKSEGTYIVEYLKSFLDWFTLLDIAIFIVFVKFIFKILKDEKYDLKKKLQAILPITAITILVLHLKFFRYAGYYVVICSQNEIPIFSMIFLQLLAIPLIYKAIKTRNEEGKDNKKIVLLILLFLAVTMGRMHLFVNVSLKSYLDIILDLIDDLIIDLTAIIIFTYTMELISTSKKEGNVENKKEEKEKNKLENEN